MEGTETLKKCNGSGCGGLYHPRSEFYKDSYSSDGLRSVCKECGKKQVAKYKQENQEKVRIANKAYQASIPADEKKDTKLRNRFNIGLVDYNAMYKAQGGVCAICHQPETVVVKGKIPALCVDHDHVTGQIRGLLCSFHNTMLGLAGDNPLILRAGADYLEQKGFHGGYHEKTNYDWFNLAWVFGYGVQALCWWLLYTNL